MPETSPTAAQTAEFREGLELLARGQDFEAHEVWEELWLRLKQQAGREAEVAWVQSFIFVAGLGVHLKNERFSPIAAMVERALELLGSNPMEPAKLLMILRRVLEEMRDGDFLNARGAKQGRVLIHSGAKEILDALDELEKA